MSEYKDPIVEYVEKLECENQVLEQKKLSEKSDSETKQVLEENVKFNSDLLPERVSKYVIDVVDRMNKAPISFAGVTALAVLSSAIGRRVGVRPKLYDDWTVIPNLWGMLVAPPSVKKSPIYTELLKPLNNLEKEEYKKFIEERKAYKIKLIAYEVEMKQYKANLKEGKENVSPPENLESPTRVRYIINDATIEKASELMIENPLGLMLTLDELQGFFSTLGKAGREGDMSFWLEAFNGNGSKNIDRIGRGSFYVPHVCASVFGTIQPDVISGLIDKTNNASTGGNGLLQRFQLIAVVHNSNFEYVDREPNCIARDDYAKLVNDLINKDPMTYGAKKDKYNEDIVFYRFSKDANDIYKDWTTKLNNKIVIEEVHSPSLAAHFGKFDGLFTSLALILFYSDKVSGIVDDDTIPGIYAQRASEICAFFESQARILYDMEHIKEKKKEQLDEKILKKLQELKIKNELPLSYGKLAEKVRGAKADYCRKVLKDIVIEKDKKIFDIRP